MMSSLSKHSFFNFFSQVTVFLTSLILSVFLARMLGPEQMGQYSYFMWLIGSGALLLTLGIPRSLIKFVSQTGDKSKITQIISQVLVFEIKILLLISPVLFIASFFVEGEKIIYLIIIATLFVSVANFILGSGLQGLQKYSLLLRINLLLAPISLILTLVVLFFNKNLTNLLITNLLVLIISTVISFFYLRRYFNFKTAPLPNALYVNFKKYALVTSLIVFVDLILMERSEVFFLKSFSTLEQLAFYSIAFGLVSKVMALIPGAISGVIMPRVSYYHSEKNIEAIKQIYFSSSRYLVLITLPIIFAGLALVDLPVQIFYGRDYLPVIPVIQVLLISGGLSAVVAAAASVLYGTGGQGFILRLGIIAAAFNIIFDIVLIPTWGAIGAAFANSIAQIIGVIVGTYYLVRVKKMPFPFKESFKILIVSFIAAFLTYLLKPFINNFSINLICSLLVLLTLLLFYIIFYVLGLISLKFFDQKDLEILRKITKRIPFPAKL